MSSTELFDQSLYLSSALCEARTWLSSVREEIEESRPDINTESLRLLDRALMRVHRHLLSGTPPTVESNVIRGIFGEDEK